MWLFAFPQHLVTNILDQKLLETKTISSLLPYLSPVFCTVHGTHFVNIYWMDDFLQIEKAGWGEREIWGRQDGEESSSKDDSWNSSRRKHKRQRMSQQAWKEHGSGGYPVHTGGVLKWVCFKIPVSVWTNLHDILETQVVEEATGASIYN